MILSWEMFLFVPRMRGMAKGHAEKVTDIYTSIFTHRALLFASSFSTLSMSYDVKDYDFLQVLALFCNRVHFKKIKFVIKLLCFSLLPLMKLKPIDGLFK